MSVQESTDTPAVRATPRRVSRGVSWTPLVALYVLTLRQHLHGKRWLVMGGLFLLPAILAIVIRATSPDVPSVAIEFMMAFMFIPQALLPLVALLYASGMVQDEQEEQTITYLLIRPIPKWALYGAKLLATLTTTVILTSAFTVVTFLAIYWGTKDPDAVSRCVKAMAIHSLAVVAYCCIFGLLSLLTKRTLVVGILYAAIVEGVFANLPFGVRLITVVYYGRIIAYRTMEFVGSTLEGTKDIAAEVWQLDIANDPTLVEHPSIATCVAVLLIGSLVFGVLAAWLCSRREFHVKTPEKN